MTEDQTPPRSSRPRPRDVDQLRLLANEIADLAGQPVHDATVSLSSFSRSTAPGGLDDVQERARVLLVGALEPGGRVDVIARARSTRRLIEAAGGALASLRVQARRSREAAVSLHPAPPIDGRSVSTGAVRREP